MCGGEAGVALFWKLLALVSGVFRRSESRLTASLEEASVLLDGANGTTGRKSSEREKLDGFHCDVCIMMIVKCGWRWV